MKSKIIVSIKIIFGVIVIILATLATITIYKLFYNELKKTDYAILFGYSDHVVKEDNLSPKYKKNDLAIIKKEYSYNVGDIILFKYYSTYKLGKIYDLERGNYVVTDNTESINKDYDVSESLVIGKAVSSIRNFGSFYEILTSSYMIVFIAIIIGVYFFIVSQGKVK